MTTCLNCDCHHDDGPGLCDYCCDLACGSECADCGHAVGENESIFQWVSPDTYACEMCMDDDVEELAS